MSLERRPAFHTLPKALGMSSATARTAPDLSKAIDYLISDYPVRGSAVNWEDLKPYWQSEKRPHYWRWSTIPLLTSFSKMLPTTERRKKTSSVVVFSRRTLPNILKNRDQRIDLPTIWKTRCLQIHIEEFSMYESLGWHFFRTTNQINFIWLQFRATKIINQSKTKKTNKKKQRKPQYNLFKKVYHYFFVCLSVFRI